MRITLLTVGSQGDVQPFVALSAGLQNSGFTVRLATHAIFEDLARPYNLDFFAVEGNPRELLEGEEGRAWLETHKNPIRFFKGLASLLRKDFEKFSRDAGKACEGADAILYSPLAMSAYDLAEKQKVPSIMLCLQPIIPTRDFPSSLMPGLRLGGSINKMSHLLARQLFWQANRKIINRWRTNVLDLRPSSFWGPFAKMFRHHYPVLMGYSPSVIPKPADWHEHVYVTGYWFLDRPAGWNPDAALLDFLQSGPPPVYIGFGSMTDRNPETLTKLLLEALRRSKKRAILHRGWAGLIQSKIDDQVFLIDSVPHDWLFPLMAAVVHHGGAGTTSAGLRAGVPNIVIPFFGDQHFWAQRVAALGAGPSPITRKHLSSEALAGAIETATSNSAIRKRAWLLGKKIQEEDGVSCAVKIITQIFKVPAFF